MLFRQAADNRVCEDFFNPLNHAIIHNFLQNASIFLNFSGFEHKIILKLFLSLKGVTLSGNERNLFKSLLMS